ncbi:hypothetical protein [Arcobacter sp. YIC-310]|uniref:hypothetical protein n=1 Tax=Arcobacter sp. YIC-310 TaxID=3376632 RepID=UPI003C1696BB
MAKIDILEKLAEDNLTIYPIEALKNEALSYTLAIFQPSENITANENEVKNVNSDSIDLKYSSFFQMTNEYGIDLVLAPEYSCPWLTVVNQFENSFPERGVLWVLGCESITIPELKCIISQNSDKVKFIVEDLDALNSRGTKNFLDPIIYCFNATNNSGGNEKIVLIQFKRRNMVDHEMQLERRHLIVGKNYYELMNDENSARLITMICAEAIQYDLELVLDKAYIIPHLQLNTAPFHPSFMDYRLKIFKERKNVEVICVNWAKGFEINGSSQSKYGASAYYMHTDKINYTDTRINENHKKGIYYTYSTSQHYHRFLFNYNEHVFYLNSNQLLQNDSANISQLRDGIETINTFSWNDSWVECTSCDDNWDGYLDSYGYLSRVSFLSSSSPISKERFLNLTSGNKLKSVKWYEPKNLKSFYIDSDEKPSKLSVFFDPRVIDASKLKEYTNNVHWLKRKVINSNISYPNKFSSLESVNDFTIYEEDIKSHLNVVNDSLSATFVGLGSDSVINAERVYSNISDAIKEEERTLVVWYENDDGDPEFYSENNNNIDADFTESRKSITNDREGE